MKQWVTGWTEEQALKHYKFYADKFDGDIEIWKIASPRSKSTWRAYIIKSSSIDIMTCCDPHYYDLLDTAIQVQPEDLQ